MSTHEHTVFEAASARIHYARLRAYFEAGHGAAVEGARTFIRVAVSEMSMMPAGRRPHFWKTVVLDAEKMVLANSKLTSHQRALLAAELRLEIQAATNAETPSMLGRAPADRTRGGRPREVREINGDKVTLFRGKVKQSIFARLCDISEDRLREAERGRATEKTLNAICRYAKKRNYPLVPLDLQKNSPQKPQ